MMFTSPVMQEFSGGCCQFSSLSEFDRRHVYVMTASCFMSTLVSAEDLISVNLAFSVL